jgi:hypothetical protein
VDLDRGAAHSLGHFEGGFRGNPRTWIERRKTPADATYTGLSPQFSGAMFPLIVAMDGRAWSSPN